MKINHSITIPHLENALASVMDPEIPVLSVMDLGMITGMEITEDQILIKMIPTFAGCPAVSVIQKNIRQELEKQFPIQVRVEIDREIPWNSNRMTQEGKEKLRQFKIAPPPQIEGAWKEDLLSGTECPYCHSTHTYLRSPFGSTLCRALHYCKDCGSLFEQFKPLE